MKKCLILAVSMLLTTAAQAETCKSMGLILNPANETNAACESLGLYGPGTIKVCTKGPSDFPPKKSEYTSNAGGTYDLTADSNSWTSKTSFSDDESGTTVTTIFTITPNRAVYYGKQITTDRRGHRSEIDCMGSIDFNL